MFILVSEIMEKLVKDGAVSKTGSDSYNINKQKVFHYFPLLTHNLPVSSDSFQSPTV